MLTYLFTLLKYWHWVSIPGFSHFLLVNISNMVNERWYLLQLGSLENVMRNRMYLQQAGCGQMYFKLTFVCILTFSMTRCVL